MREAVIVAGARTPVGRAKKGSLANVRPDDLGALVVKETLKRAGNYEGTIDDLIIGCAMPEAEQGMNMARNIGALAGLPYTVPAITINRYLFIRVTNYCLWSRTNYARPKRNSHCGWSRIDEFGSDDGTCSSSKRKLAETAPEYYMGMGHTAEEVANKYGISREDQDAFAVRSHQKAAKAIAEGKFTDEIVPVEVTHSICG